MMIVFRNTMFALFIFVYVFVMVHMSESYLFRFDIHKWKSELQRKMVNRKNSTLGIFSNTTITIPSIYFIDDIQHQVLMIFQ
jgi:hypothetical protein